MQQLSISLFQLLKQLTKCVILREHYQWNMDIWGVGGVEAEAELLAAIITSFKAMGITSEDVGIKV